MKSLGVIIGIVSLLALFGCSTGKNHWNYKGEHDPSHWHELAQSKVCKMGHHQSPISIYSKNTEKLNQILEIFYHKAPLEVINNGHTVEFDTTDRHFIKVDKQRYDLVQFHFHAHSEHAIDGKFFPAEMHLVHKSKQGETVVLAVYQEIAGVGMSSHVFDQIPSIGEKTVVKLDLESLLPKDKARFVYDGSLTTPPCTENVTWLVFKKPVALTKKELNKFKMFYSGNFRPLQKEYLRKVYLAN